MPEKDDEPQVSFSSVLAGKRARVIAMSGDLTAVVLPDQKLLVIYNGDGSQRSAYPLDVPAGDLAQDPPGDVEATTQTAQNVYWFSGSKVLALSRDDLSPRWTLSSALGPGITFAHRMSEEIASPAPDIVRSHTVASQVFAMPGFAGNLLSM